MAIMHCLVGDDNQHHILNCNMMAILYGPTIKRLFQWIWCSVNSSGKNLISMRKFEFQQI